MRPPNLKGSGREVFQLGLDALGRSDWETYTACVAELRSRDTRLARELAEELAEERGAPSPTQQTRGAVPWPRGVSSEIAGVDRPVVLLTDGEIVAARTRLLEGAERSIWLSTYVLSYPFDESRP